MDSFSPPRDRARRFPSLPGNVNELPIGFLVLLLGVGQIVLWSLAFGLSYSAPEIDSAEQFVWAFSLENGYWKHPPVPSWIMGGLLALAGPSIVLPFAAAQICIVIALALTWRLGCEFVSPRRSLVAVALTSLVTYHNMGGDNFNHNTVLLPFQAATVLLFFLATRRGGLHRWALAGLFAGLSMLVKYVALMPIAGLLIYLALDRRLHNRRVFAGLGVAALVFMLVLLPHALWLQRIDFLPFRYARSVAQGAHGVDTTIRSAGEFLLMQAVRLIPFALGLAWVARAESTGSTASSPAALEPSNRLFLWITAAAPLVLTLAFCIATTTELQSRWGTNAFLLVGVLAHSLRKADPTDRTLMRTVIFVMSTHIVLAVGMTTARTTLADELGLRTRANFPGAVLAHEANKAWSAHTSAPLRIVVSDIWLGGNILANSRDRVAVLIDGHEFKSPWVRAQAIDACGALVLDDLTSGGRTTPNPALDALMSRARFTGVWNLPWAVPQKQATEQGTGRVKWGVVPPVEGKVCSL